ncbi:aspartate/tyrosine/aromatic aminotransferase [Vibrio sp. SS-MA-C1-2]|uniref:amino acid aminotransferase n=1 Tax=Vibrio sp. SS-MA-C1-2 TaxID=2908646 RepID=UPI001F1FFDF5|nr:amino acid aminotransferase [Vibrio sp. SS-MA-C1-2]UJF17376.1 aspartate/tyrosine/aromatic aminotransferase [Vibrio sp. SS-MA-C1-2]
MFSHLKPAKQDPILSLSLLYQEDTRENKMDLGVGVYRNNDGETPIMSAIKKAQQMQAETQQSKVYLGLAGNLKFSELLTKQLLDGTSALERSVTIQTPGGSGALRMLAELIAASQPDSTVWLSDPSYVNHKPIMEAVGLTVKYYPYLNRETFQVDSEAMLKTLSQLGRNDVVILHGCCHNPSGADISLETWQKIADLANQTGFTPFVDMAYQGFGDGLEQDAAGMRLLAEQVDEMVIATSCSKNFGLYRERTGAAIVIAKEPVQAGNAKSRLLKIARSTYTMPPDHGADLVVSVLSDKQLLEEWQQELLEMHQRMITLRHGLADRLATLSGNHRFDFIKQHKGMFSILGLTVEQIQKLRNEFAIYLVEDSRINIAGLQEDKLDVLAQAIHSVTTK